MKPKRKPKCAKPQLASKDDREMAGMIACGLRNPLGPTDEAPPGVEVWDIGLIISLLEHFAKHGTFDRYGTSAVSKRLSRAWQVADRFRWIRKHTDTTYEVAVEDLANEFGCSESTIRTLVRLATAK